MALLQPEKFVAELPCWQGNVSLKKIDGGISNENFLITDADGKRYVARVNGDVPDHGVLRINDYNCNRAAAKAGIAPEVHHYQPGVLVVDYVKSRTLEKTDIQNGPFLEPIIDLIKKTHYQAYRQLRGPVCAFWPFRICRDYGFYLQENQSRMTPELTAMMDINDTLEKSVGAYPPVLGHNDFLAANLLDDGTKLWLIDWEHAGLTSPLFDLANLASNNDLTPDQENQLLAQYFGPAMSADKTDHFTAMKSASLLREAMWSMVQECQSEVDFDYVAYSDDCFGRFQQSLGFLKSLF